MYDVAIVGAGPAGATLARLLGKQYKVLLVDRRRLDKDKSVSRMAKSCGGLVAPDAQAMLASMGLGLPEHVLVGPQLFVVRTIDLNNGYERYYQRFYTNIDREEFDRWLVSLIPSRVAACFGAAFCGYRHENGGFSLHLRLGNRQWTEQARLLVGADGANSLVRRQALPAGPSPKRYVAIQEWFRVEQAMPYFTAIFDSSLTDFYGWTIPKREQLLVGLALAPGSEADARFQQFKLRLQRRGLDLRQRTRREGAFILRPRAKEATPVADGVALVGEAAGWISPSSAQGLSYAFSSALMLGESLRVGLDGAFSRYRRASRLLRLKLLGKNLKSPAMYQPWLRSLAMHSGLLSLHMHGED